LSDLQYLHFIFERQLIVYLIIAEILGGSIGSWLSSNKLNLRFIGVLTAILVLYAGLRLVLLHGFGIQI